MTRCLKFEKPRRTRKLFLLRRLKQQTKLTFLNAVAKHINLFSWLLREDHSQCWCQSQGIYPSLVSNKNILSLLHKCKKKLLLVPWHKNNIVHAASFGYDVFMPTIEDCFYSSGACSSDAGKKDKTTTNPAKFKNHPDFPPPSISKMARCLKERIF